MNNPFTSVCQRFPDFFTAGISNLSVNDRTDKRLSFRVSGTGISLLGK